MILFLLFVGTLLLQIGEMGCVVQSLDLDFPEDGASVSSLNTKFAVEEDKSSVSESDCSSKLECIGRSDSCTVSLKHGEGAQKDWSVTFKQFQGTFYMQQVLISQFDHKIDISSEIELYRKRCFEKMITSWNLILKFLQQFVIIFLYNL